MVTANGEVIRKSVASHIIYRRHIANELFFTVGLSSRRYDLIFKR